MRIEEIFKYILTEQEFVSIPGVGSFVRCTENASISAQSHAIVPPSIHYEFDTSRTFNDEAIARFLCEYAGEDRYAAEQLVNTWVQWVQEELNANRTVQFEGLGTLYISEGTTHFEPANKAKTAAETLALQPVSLPPVRKRAKAPKRGKRVAIVLLTVVGLIGAGAAGSYIALDRWPTELVDIPFLAQTKQNAATDTPARTVENQPTAPDTVRDNSRQSVELPRGMAQNHRQGDALNMNSVDNRPKVEYYLIAGSFAQRENADKRCKELSDQGYSTEVVRMDTIYRVTIGGLFSSKSDAVRRMVEARAATHDNGIWILERTQE